VLQENWQLSQDDGSPVIIDLCAAIAAGEARMAKTMRAEAKGGILWLRKEVT
jgi:hypothetical protein